MIEFPKLASRFINLELTNKSMSLQTFTKEDWLDRIFRKSDSRRTETVAKTSLHMFERFCQNEGIHEEEMITTYQTLAKEGDIRNICLSLDRFVQFLNQDHPEIEYKKTLMPTSFKKKSPKTIKVYFSFIKSYLRICHAIKISSDDIKDYVQFPRLRKEPRRAIPIETLKLIFSGKPGALGASPSRKALYYVLISSGMRIGEALALRKKNFHFNEDPVRVTVEAEITKTKEGRETYISSEAVDKLKSLIEGKGDNDGIFTAMDDIDKAVNFEEQIFSDLRERLGLLEKYPNSTRYVVNIHAFRAYFHTKASQKHGSDYANALDGHGAYLKQYYRETPEERAKKYKELESSLLIESVKLEVEKTKDKVIETLQEQVQKLQHQMEVYELTHKIELPNTKQLVL